MQLASGHGTEAYIVATVLQNLLNSAQGGNGSATGNSCSGWLRGSQSTAVGLPYPVDSAAARLLEGLG